MPAQNGYIWQSRNMNKGYVRTFFDQVGVTPEKWIRDGLCDGLGLTDVVVRQKSGHPDRTTALVPYISSVSIYTLIGQHQTPTHPTYYPQSLAHPLESFGYRPTTDGLALVRATG